MTEFYQFDSTEQYLRHAFNGITTYSRFAGLPANDTDSGLPAWREHLWFLERGLNIPYFMIYDVACLLEGKFPPSFSPNGNRKHRRYAQFINRHSDKLGNVRQLIRFRKLAIEPAAILRSYMSEILYNFNLSNMKTVLVSTDILKGLADAAEPGTWDKIVSDYMDDKVKGKEAVKHPQLYLDIFESGEGDSPELFDEMPELLARHFYLAHDELKCLDDSRRHDAPAERKKLRSAQESRHLDMELIEGYRAGANRTLPYRLLQDPAKQSLKPVSSEEETRRIESFRTLGHGDPPFPPSELAKPPALFMRDLAEGSLMAYKDLKPEQKPLNILAVFAVHLPPAEFSVGGTDRLSDVTRLKSAAALAAHDLLRFVIARGIPQVDIAFYLYSKRAEDVYGNEIKSGPQASMALLKGDYVRANRQIADPAHPVLLTIREIFPVLFYHTPPWKHHTEKLGYHEVALGLKEWLHWHRRQNQWDKIQVFFMGTQQSLEAPLSEDEKKDLKNALIRLNGLPADTFKISLKHSQLHTQQHSRIYPQMNTIRNPQSSRESGNTGITGITYTRWQPTVNVKQKEHGALKEKEEFSAYPFHQFRDWVIKKVLKT